MTTTPTLTTCLVCGDPDPAPVLSGLVQRCRDCGFAWTAVAGPGEGHAGTDAAADAALYGAGYFTGGSSERATDSATDRATDRATGDPPAAGYTDYFQPSARRFEAARRLSWLLGFGPVDSLIEFGCAGGFFLEAAEQEAIDATGYDVAESAVRYARSTLGVQAVIGGFESAPWTRPVDAVCGFHVLEHVADPHRMLRLARRHLRPGGLLALEVPNFASSAAARLGTDWEGLQPDFHRWHFGPDSLSRLVTDHGFDVLSCDTVVFRSYMPPRFRRRRPALAVADLLATRSLRLVQPVRGDLLRLVGRRREST